MIKVYSDNKIYVVAPAASSTGGPELLHQLVYHLINDLDIEAYIYYIPPTHPDPVHPAYKNYRVPFVRQIEDKERNILIVPEVHTGVSLLKYFKNIRKVLWWLSVDNFYLSYIFRSKLNFFTQRLINYIYKKFRGKNLFDLVEIALENEKFKKLQLPIYIKKADYHLVQSFYALNFIKSKGITQNKIYYLSDYLNESFLETKTDLSEKENIVVYNPKKGFVFTEKIIKAAKEIKFVPIINMSREEVIKTLQKSKVYIDFGNHPGKDRMPREAAILGCCVITGKRGSAAFFEDVPIPDEYKFEDKEENIPRIIEKIKDCFENFEERYKDFDYYREIIKNEPKKFEEDLKKIFVRGEK
ncbi:MAG: hypothetical protein PWR24_1806 [Desulfonauticus sp.]|nr:hypothetical protein [Desulfonauticus sp.]